MYEAVETLWDAMARRGVLETDVAAATSRMDTAFLPHLLQLQDLRRGFELTHSELQLDDITVHAVSYNRRMRVETAPFRHFYCIHFSAGAGCDYRSGSVRAQTTPGHVYVSGVDRCFQQTLPPRYRQVTLKIERRSVERFLVDELRAPLSQPLEFPPEPIPLTDELVVLLKQLELIALAPQRSAAPGTDRVSQQFSRTILALALAALPSNYQERFRGNASAEIPAYLVRAESFLRSNLRGAISLEDLVAASGVSRRALTLAFRTHLKQSPMQYLRARRLQLARDELVAAGRRGVGTVTDVAISCGFTHLSKFARDFAVAFGEPPSRTLRRSARA